MKCEEMIKEVYFVAGVLEGMTYAKGSLMTEAMESKLADCVDRLELVGAQLLEAGAPKYTIKGTISDEDMALLMKPSKAVIANERLFQDAFGRVYPAQEDASDQ